MSVSSMFFGTLSDGTAVTAYRLENSAGASVTVLDYGAAVQSLLAPDRSGALRDVVLGYDTAAEYERGTCFFGAAIGRVANRIGGASFSLNGKTYPLAKNDGPNHLHGGVKGFDKRLWQISTEEGSLICSRLSPDGEEGYPGNLRVRVTYTLTEENALRIRYDAETDQDTPVNLTNHSYFNLNGGGSVLGHRLLVNAERFCENDADCLPTGKLLPVEDTPFDFRRGKALGDDIDADNPQLRLAGGYDHNYCLSGSMAAELYSPDSGIRLTVRTDLPGMQVYSGNSIVKGSGRGGAAYGPRCALCLETQLYPNGMNCYGFPSPILRAGTAMHSETSYSFDTYL